MTAELKASAVVAAIGLVLAGAACGVDSPAETNYATRIETARRAKDEAWKQENAPPIPKERKADFLPLLYYPVDPSYEVPAELKPSAETPTMTMPTSTGEMRPMRRVGQLQFSLKGQPFKLTAFVEAGAPDVSHLFVPFKDLTSGMDTYEAGRYLDLDRNATGLYNLDFNLAYTPNCHFSPMYSCPIPPKENHLPIEIKAGEKVKTAS